MTDSEPPRQHQPLATCALLATLLASLPAQQGGQPAPKPAPHASSWPELDGKLNREARNQVKQFQKDGEQLHRKAHQRLVELGAGVAPILIPMVHDRDNNVNTSLFSVLDEVCTPRHATLLAKEVGRPSLALRRYLLRRLGGFHDTAVHAVMTDSLKDKDAEVRFQAALGLLGLADVDGIDVVLQAARERWPETRAQIEATLTPARKAVTADKVLAHIARAQPTDQMAGLRVLRFLMEKRQASTLRHYLTAADFAVKREAINTARVLHGEAPLEKLSSFQAINLAKQWLQKL